MAPRPRGVGVRGVGGGVGCPPRGDAAARCLSNHNALNQEHKGQMRSLPCSRVCAASRGPQHISSDLAVACAICLIAISRIAYEFYSHAATLRRTPWNPLSFGSRAAPSPPSRTRTRWVRAACQGQRRRRPPGGRHAVRCRCDGKLHGRGGLRRLWGIPRKSRGSTREFRSLAALAHAGTVARGLSAPPSVDSDRDLSTMPPLEPRTTA